MRKMNFSLNFLHTTFLVPEIPLFYLGTAKAGQDSWSVNSYVGHDMVSMDGYQALFCLMRTLFHNLLPTPMVLSHLAQLRLKRTSVSWIAITNLT